MGDPGALWAWRIHPDQRVRGVVRRGRACPSVHLCEPVAHPVVFVRQVVGARPAALLRRQLVGGIVPVGDPRPVQFEHRAPVSCRVVGRRVNPHPGAVRFAVFQHQFLPRRVVLMAHRQPVGELLAALPVQRVIDERRPLPERVDDAGQAAQSVPGVGGALRSVQQHLAIPFPVQQIGEHMPRGVAHFRRPVGAVGKMLRSTRAVLPVPAIQ